VAAGLLQAARALGRNDWEGEALSIARDASRRQFAEAVVYDACLCHGAAGAAHLFNRFFHATGDDSFRQAALAWYGQALSYRREGEGIGGYRYYTANPEMPQEGLWHDKAGFLEGAAGIALALLAGFTPVEPAWDACLLLQIS
jgi:hypothetical protein